jgi:nitrogen fixation protein NifB
MEKTMSLDLSRHPCFSESARHEFGRVHLPVATTCNVQCNFCDRRHDCPNESRPGVTSAVVSPGQAIAYLEQVLARDPRIAVVGIAGPGDPFAQPEVTLETLHRVRRGWPEMLLCVASNGLNAAPFAEELARIGVSHVTLTINAVEAEIASRIYGWVRSAHRVYRGLAAGEVMVERQLEAMRAIKRRGLVLKINTILVPGINDEHVEAVAEAVAREGADMQNIIALCPVAGTPFGDLPEPTPETVAELRVRAGRHLPQMAHCTRCRADAVGRLGEAVSDDLRCCLARAASGPLEPRQARPYVAVASREKLFVNQHIGEATEFHVYAPADGAARLVDTREAPPSGGADLRWTALGERLADCRALLCSGAGAAPQRVLGAGGLEVIVTEGLIDESLAAVFSGRGIRSPARPHRCGENCRGDGNGCG